MLIKNHLN